MTGIYVRRLAGIRLAAVFFMGAVAASPAPAASLQTACFGDYLNYCSSHAPNTPAMKSCMKANGLKLSQGCVNALVANGYLSKAEADRRRTAKP